MFFYLFIFCKNLKNILVIRLLLLGQKGGHYEVAYSFNGLILPHNIFSNTAQATDWYYVSPDDKDPEPIEGNTNGQAIYRLLWQQNSLNLIFQI